MSHQRTAIRTALKTLLIGISPFNTDAEDRVYTNRVHATKTIPTIIINDGQETATPRDVSNYKYIRTWDLNIDAKVKANEGFDTELDNICKQIEDVISTNRTISGTAMSCVYSGTEFSFEEAETVIAKATITYKITYIS